MGIKRVHPHLQIALKTRRVSPPDRAELRSKKIPLLKQGLMPLAGLNFSIMNTNVDKKTDTLLDTSGQLPTGLKILQKRARSKWYTQGVVGGLLGVDSKLHKYYQRAYFCCDELIQKGDRIHTKYCDTRLCNVCNRIRTAKMMLGYISQLEGRSLEFVTLTVPNVDGASLLSTIEGMTKQATGIQRVFRERRGIQMNGIRKLEITYNATMSTYHPHFHFLVDGGHGQALIDEWLVRYPKANRQAQDCRPANRESLNELFKYTTKIIALKKQNFVVYVKAVDTIMTSLYGKRCFQPFGDIRKVKEEVVDELAGQVYDGVPVYEFMSWGWNECDWVNEYGETLTGYVSPDVDFIYQ